MKYPLSRAPGQILKFAESLKPAFARLTHVLGLNERRCRNCLSPFVPESFTEELCPACRKHFAPYRGPACPLCGEPPFARLCLACLRGRPWNSLAYHGLYAGALRDMLLRLKYGGEIALAPFLAGLLLEASISLPRPDAIVPVPQYPPHLRQRGYNQAHEIARHLSAMSAIPMDAGLLSRIRHPRRQASLTREERAANVRGNFRASGRAAGKSIWLLDDVMTTGSTFMEAAGSLLSAGCLRVSLIFVARTPRD